MSIQATKNVQCFDNYDLITKNLALIEKALTLSEQGHKVKDFSQYLRAYSNLLEQKNQLGLDKNRFQELSNTLDRLHPRIFNLMEKTVLTPSSKTSGDGAAVNYFSSISHWSKRKLMIGGISIAGLTALSLNPELRKLVINVCFKGPQIFSMTFRSAGIAVKVANNIAALATNERVIKMANQTLNQINKVLEAPEDGSLFTYSPILVSMSIGHVIGTLIDLWLPMVAIANDPKIPHTFGTVFMQRTFGTRGRNILTWTGTIASGTATFHAWPNIEKMITSVISGYHQNVKPRFINWHESVTQWLSRDPEFDAEFPPDSYQSQ
ncbi:MAG TPA: hypothetical protein VLE95_05495 [Chlamydiales bacterium]|nr:hypothetical protein [Chlamydiales bacterium]